jgi:hypothetical protein
MSHRGGHQGGRMTKREREIVEREAYEALWTRGGALLSREHVAALTMTAYALSTQHGRRRLR